MAKRKTTKRKPSRSKKKLIGYTRTEGKYRLVFQSGKKKTLGQSKYSTKATLKKGARRYL